MPERRQRELNANGERACALRKNDNIFVRRTRRRYDGQEVMSAEFVRSASFLSDREAVEETEGTDASDDHEADIVALQTEENV